MFSGPARRATFTADYTETKEKKSKICFAVDDDHQKIDNIKLFNLSTITMTINK
jgi:hypothetical protein